MSGERLKMITKITDYELKKGRAYEGAWHVEGMSHVEIVATAIYFIHRDDAIGGGDILLKRASYRDEGLIPLGTVKTISKRLLVFLKSHVHKVPK